MIKLMKSLLCLALIFLFNACYEKNSNVINKNIERVDYNSIKSISDITSIGFEWKRIEDTRVAGYNIYRANLQDGERISKLIAHVKSRYATHYVDKNLNPKTKYAYQISSKLNDGSESVATEPYIIETLKRIAPVSGAQAISKLPKKIKILWEPHHDQKVKYYRIEKYNTLLNEWIYLKKINGRLNVEYFDSGLDDNSTHQYRIKSFTYDDIESAPTKALIATTKPLPKSPKNIKVTTNIPKQISISWLASETEDVVQYNILRSSYPSFGFSLYKKLRSSTLEYTDSIEEDGKAYYYKVIAVDKDDLKSIDSINPLRGATLTKPMKPIITSSEIQNSVVINWQPGDNRAVSYNVIRETKESFFKYRTLIFNNIKGTNFVDNNITKGTTYRYSVQAVDKNGLTSENSDQKVLTSK